MMSGSVDRKVCGILIEQAERSPNRLVVGIGINVNNSFLGAPGEQRQVATSMIDAAQAKFSRTDVLVRFLSNWNSLVRSWRKEPSTWWNDGPRMRPFGPTGRRDHGLKETTGICRGIDDQGCLLLRTAFSLERCYAGTVRLLTDASTSNI